MENLSEYKRGVEAVLNHLLNEDMMSQSGVDSLRKKLLTRKVTKWINLYGNPESSVGQIWYYDNKAAAEAVRDLDSLGPFPIEIEAPL